MTLLKKVTRLTAVLITTSVLSGCAFLLVGGALVGGAVVATDRRSSGTQVDDQAIEFKAGPRVREVVGTRGHVNVVSYNRLALITGEVPTEEDKATMEQKIAAIENVRSVVNELAVMPASSLTERSNDALITSKVKATLVDAGDVSSHAFKVVTERSTVYLMGRVTEREATRVVEIVRTIRGVEKVVRVFEIVTEDELMGLPSPAKPVEPNVVTETGPVTSPVR
jgi:osmotically-inducible protein OsmY